MKCSACQKEMVADRRFCPWCESYVPNPAIGTKAGIGLRLGAHVVDGLVFAAVLLVSVLVLGALAAGIQGAGGSQGTAVGVFLLSLFIGFVVYVVVIVKFLAKGLTPGKYLVGEQVVDHLTGGQPGLGKMLLREIIGKWVSGLLFGLGYLWAIWDKDGQAWHDKIAGTVVIRRAPDGGPVTPTVARPV
jgi:uncharacterized RDD family membrane protein YckC